jgi:hypothetical protein
MASAIELGSRQSLARVRDPAKLVAEAALLREPDRKAIALAIKSESFEMAMAFVWTRTMAALRKQLDALGGAFIGEMLGRDDWANTASIDQQLTDAETVRLALELGLVESSQAMRLRQVHELLGKSASNAYTGEEGLEISREDAVTCLRACVEAVLSKHGLEVPSNFRALRDRLLSGKVEPGDDMIEALLSSPYFFLRTIVASLVSALRSADQGQAERVSSNLRAILPSIWKKLDAAQKWQIGRAYAAAHDEGRAEVADTIRLGISESKGFDFVPESLRSDNFRRHAAELLRAHSEWHNFYNEPGPARKLASLGESVPAAALGSVLQAALCSFLGNNYGICFDAQAPVRAVLGSLRREQWEEYFENFFHRDDQVLAKLSSEKPIERWSVLVDEFKLGDLSLGRNRVVQMLKKKQISVNSQALLAAIYGGG